jgi:hypothetical protein
MPGDGSDGWKTAATVFAVVGALALFACVGTICAFVRYKCLKLRAQQPLRGSELESALPSPINEYKQQPHLQHTTDARQPWKQLNPPHKLDVTSKPLARSMFFRAKPLAKSMKTGVAPIKAHMQTAANTSGSHPVPEKFKKSALPDMPYFSPSSTPQRRGLDSCGQCGDFNRPIVPGRMAESSPDQRYCHRCWGIWDQAQGKYAQQIEASCEDSPLRPADLIQQLKEAAAAVERTQVTNVPALDTANIEHQQANILWELRQATAAAEEMQQVNSEKGAWCGIPGGSYTGRSMSGVETMRVIHRGHPNLSPSPPTGRLPPPLWSSPAAARQIEAINAMAAVGLTDDEMGAGSFDI